MERTEALEKLAQIHRRDLVELAAELGVPLLGASGKKNKGWAGHTFERYLGLPLNSSRAPKYVELNISTFQKGAGKSPFPVQRTFFVTRFARFI